MKTFFGSLALVVALVLCGSGIAAGEAGAPVAADTPCAGCPQAQAGKAGAQPVADRMKAHVEGMKGALAALRESEKALAGTEDPKAFRAAVVEHLKKLDDLEASHLTHMESMMERAQGGMPGMHHGKRGGCKCEDCPCRDCKGKDCSHKGDCCCHRECCDDGGHKH